MDSSEVIIEGYFCIAKEYPNIDRFTLDSSLFKLSARKFKIADLRVLNLERIIGSFISPLEVVGVVDLSGSLIPFFVKKQKVIELKQLQRWIQSCKNQASNL